MAIHGNVVITNIVVSPMATLGINVNPYIDGDVHRPKGSKNLRDTLKMLKPATIRPTNGYMADTVLWATHPTWEPASQKPSVYGWNYWASNDKRLYTTPPKPGGEFINTLNFADIVKVRPAGCQFVIAVPLMAAYAPQSPQGYKEYLLKVAVKWVEYTKARNIPVKYWEISNESTMKSNILATISAKQYAEDVVVWSKAMKAANPTAKIAANGETAEDFKTVLKIAGDYIDAVVVHSYGPWQYPGYSQFATQKPDYTHHLRECHSGIGTRKINIIITELNVIDFSKTLAPENDTGKALMVFDMLGQHLSGKYVSDIMFWETRAFNEGRDGFPKLLKTNNTLQPAGVAFTLWTRFAKRGNFTRTVDNTPGVISYCVMSKGKPVVWIMNKTLTTKNTNVYIPRAMVVKSAFVFKGKAYTDKNPTLKPRTLPKFIGNKSLVDLPPVSITILSF